MLYGNAYDMPSFDVNPKKSMGLPGLEKLRGMIKDAGAVSFAFFDTLFVRPLAHPEDVFQILANQFSIPDFAANRSAAQAEALRRMIEAGRKEIHLKDIYNCIAEMGLPADELMSAEYNLELKLLEPNPDLFPLLYELLDSEMPIVITSDTYFSADFFREALRLHGLVEFPLFISADYNATKRDSGELFEKVAASLGLPANKILHVGRNPLSDVERAREKGMLVFKYRPTRRLFFRKGKSLSTSIGIGLLRTRARGIDPNSYAGLGFVYGGPGNVGFLHWIRDNILLNQIDHVLFLSRVGHAIGRTALEQMKSDFPAFTYFFGSRTAFTLACVTADNFTTYIPYFLSGAEGLAPCELLQRIGVQPPAPKIMYDLGLGDDKRITYALHTKLADFLYAYRWEILKVCQRNKRSLYIYLNQLGLKSGNRVAIVDVGWSGSTQTAFENAVQPMMQLDVYGYYLCLANSIIESQKQPRRMALFNENNTPHETLRKLCDNRLLIELLFSGPHNTIIGLDYYNGKIHPVMAPGRGRTKGLRQIAERIGYGVESFSDCYGKLQDDIDLRITPYQLASPIIELVKSHTDLEAGGFLADEKNSDSHSSLKHKIA